MYLLKLEELKSSKQKFKQLFYPNIFYSDCVRFLIEHNKILYILTNILGEIEIQEENNFSSIKVFHNEKSNLVKIVFFDEKGKEIETKRFQDKDFPLFNKDENPAIHFIVKKDTLKLSLEF